MSENENNEYLSILKEIFHFSSENPSEIYPIVQNPDKISEFKSYMENKNIGNLSKLSLLKQLKSFFLFNKILIPFFIEKCNTNTSNFYSPIINLYLDEDIDKENLKFLEDFLFLLNSHISIPRLSLELIYQKLSEYYRNKGKNKLTESLLIRYLHLLQIFYKDISIKDNIEEEISSQQEEKQLKNYIYLNGYGSGLNFTLNLNSSNYNASFPTLENGCSFFFWINLNEKLLQIYTKIYPKIEICLIKINIAAKQIKLLLKEGKHLQIVIDESESNIIDLSSTFQFNNWNNICLVFEKPEKNKIKLIINNATNYSNILFPKNFPIHEKIDTIKCFENLIGRVSSLLFFSFPLEQKVINHFSIQLKHGFYKNKILFRFLHSNDNEYLDNSKNYKYIEKFKNEKKLEKEFKIHSQEQNIKNIICFFCPFAYNKSENEIDDIFGNYIGILSNNDGVNFYINCTKNIKPTGGMNNLLPIAEIMYSSKMSNQNISYPLVDKNILTENTLYEFLIIIKHLLVGHRQNLFDANKSKFFSSLGLFLEKFPSRIYTEKVLHVLVDIGKEIFKSEFDYNTSRNDNYINMILLNEKIFSKFTEENQRKLWDNVYQFFTSDYSQMKDSLNISKICLLLRFYDEKRYDEYCCSEHAKIFSKIKGIEKEDTIKIMNPEMSDKVDKLFDTIQIYIDKLETDETINLYKLLSLDLSPCLQKKIIQVYVVHFESQNVSSTKKKSTLNNLLDNDYIEITEYVLSISLLDVRIQILSLFKIIVSDYYDIFISHFPYSPNDMNLANIRFTNIINFMAENLLPDKLQIEVSLLQSKDDKYSDLSQNFSLESEELQTLKRSNTEKNVNIRFSGFKVLSKESMILTNKKNLIEYFNKNIYDSQISSLYKFLNEWSINYIVKKKKILSYIIDFLIMLVCKISPDYIDSFSNYLFSCFNRNDILNKNLLFENVNIYPWLIETIFFFNNSENMKLFSDKNTISKIQYQISDLFTEIFSTKRPLNEFKSRIKYILDYSYYMKYIHKNDNNKKNEVEKITRTLLEKLIGCSPGNINIKTEACFEFLVYYKNSENLFKINFEIGNKEVRSVSCFFTKLSKSDFNDIKDENNNENENLNDNENKNVINENKINLESINNDDDNTIFNSKTENNIEENKNSLLMTRTEINESNILQVKDYLPKYILEGLFIKDSNNSSQVKTLSEIWEDFSIYDNIIDYYHSNLWGIENVCKKVNIEYNGKWYEICDSLLKEYGMVNSKKNKNLLFEEILKLLNMSYDEYEEQENLEEKENKQKNIHNNINYKKDLMKSNDDIINILNINIILLSIAIEITKDSEQKEFLEKQFQQFLIFCILASININTSVKNHDLIQDLLYNVLSFGCLFLKKKEESKYNELIKHLIEPIIQEINDDLNKGGIRTIFGLQRKMFYRNTAVFKLFASISLDDGSIKKEKDKESPKYDSAQKRSTRLTTSDKVTAIKLKKNLFNLDENEKEENVDEMTVNNRKNINKNKVYFEFHGNENEIINNLFDSTLEKYKKNRENPDNRAKIRNYYEINKNEYDLDIGVIEEKNKVKEKIKELIPIVESQIKQYSNTSFLQEKKRRNKYKKMKKRLFSWRGFWSDRYLFFEHPEYLKVKIKNHFTKEMVKPLFSPVLDIDYYLPNFSKFDKKKLFNKDNYEYNLKLDIDEILGDENLNVDIEESKINEEENENNNKESNNASTGRKSRISINTYYNKFNEGKNFHGIKNCYGFNYLECLYKLNYEDIWELYNTYSEQRISLGKKEINTNIDKSEIFKSQISSDSSKQKLLLSTLEGKIMTKHFRTLNCCIVKPTHHIKGNISTKNKYFQFLYEDNTNKSLEMLQDEIENDPNFDKDMGCCYGSIFKNHKKDKDNTAFILEYSKIKYMFIRIYFYKESGLEIYTTTNKSYFLNFKTKEDMHLFLNDILSIINYREIKSENKRILGYEQLFNQINKKKSYNIMNKMDDWQNYMISTLEYLMWLNIYSGRSFNDLTQYPVIPWMISNYELKQIQYKNHHRDLSIPMGMIEIDNNDKSLTRKETYLETYESLKNDFKDSNPDFNYETYLQKGDEYFDNYKAKKLKIKLKEEKKNNDNMNEIGEEYEPIQINQIPYYYGSHYSNPTYVSHYLTRIFPYSFVSIEIQGDKFDDPDRMFISMTKTFDSACTLKDDVRELIPEFYILSGMFLNKNNLNLAQGKIDSEGNEININDVILPPWSDNNPTNFVSEMRKVLETYDDKLNKWIDLIFGSCQRGEKAEEVHNIYMAQTYEKMIKIEEITDPDIRSTLMRLIEIGVTPFKILFNDSKPRFEKNQLFQKSPLYSYSKGSFLYDCKQLEKLSFNTKNYKKIFNKKDNKDNKDEIKTIEIYPKIISINWIDNETLKIFTNTNKWYDIKFTIFEKEITNTDLDIHSFENNSSKYASSYQISSLNNNPFIVYGKSKYIIKGGFWDGRIEFNSIPTEPKEQPISKCIFSTYGKPIVVMEISDDEKYLVCGTTTGLVSIYDINLEKIKILTNTFLHSDEITSISINTILNMFATVSKDGYLLLYILPSVSLVRAIRLSTKIIKNKNIYEVQKEEKTEEKTIDKKEEIIDDKKEEKKEENKKEIKNEENKEESKEENKEVNEKEIDEDKSEIKKEEEKKEIKEDNVENKEENKELEGKKEEIIENEFKEDKKYEENIINDKKDYDNKNEINLDENIINTNKINQNTSQNDTNDKDTEEKENDDFEGEEQLYADNVFLSSSPLPCVTVYISQKKLFRTYTINGEFVSEEKEEDELGSKYIKSPIVFKNLYFQDFLIYGTDKGYVKIRSFPKMNIIGKILEVTPGISIETLTISKDKRYCYVWSKGSEIYIIKDVSVSSIQVSENISRMGFNIGY